MQILRKSPEQTHRTDKVFLWGRELELDILVKRVDLPLSVMFEVLNKNVKI